VTNNQSDSGHPPSSRFNLRDVAIVLAVAWAVRLAFILIVPPGARSLDAFSWESIGGLMIRGENPYHTTALLNWPPLWMQLIFCLSKIAAALGAPFFRVLQIFLVLVESAVIVLLVRLIKEVAPAAPARAIAIVGLALNPIAVLLICQHCNFDVIVALWLMLFMLCLLRYNRSNDPAAWLGACLFLGLAILTKTVPIALIPMLAGGFRRVTSGFRFLGGVLLLGPVALGMSIIFVLAPDDVLHKVLLYHSQSDRFGITGLLHMAGADGARFVPDLSFCAALALVMLLSAGFFWRHNAMSNRETVLYAAILLAAIPSLGPGYGTQYIYWFMPFLVATCAFYTGRWRIVLAVFAVISIGTYLVEYALLPEYGSTLLYLLNPAATPEQIQSPASLPHPLNPLLIEKMDSATGHTLFRLPLFMAYLALIAFGILTLFHNLRIQPKNVRACRNAAGHDARGSDGED
jgi:hypothetical protein